MEGLEDVVERIIPELALSGENGVSVDEFLELIKEYSTSGHLAYVSLPQAGVTQDALPGDSNLALARVLWSWLTARPEVLVGGNKRWNRLSLDEVLALPEPQPSKDESDLADSQPPLKPRGAARGAREKVKAFPATPETRPRLHVTEDTIWRRLTRHGVDYKRVPNLEWQCLLGIASSKREGILQVDLRRLVNQDKRSVPKRTDFLTAKGYIVKRSQFAVGSKTSRLWLADLAPTLYSADGGVPPASSRDMSKAALLKDTSPVFWHKKWTAGDIDVEAFAETLIAIVKAWGVMRYSDLRSKMGVEELKWQMRTMSRLTRNLVNMGILRYAMATFVNSRRIWKDCIKFIRDPTEEEWTQVLATGKKTSKRLNSLGGQQSSESVTASKKGKHHRPPKLTEEKDENREPPAVSTFQPLTSSWTPEKPIAHTLFDAVKSAGPQGISTPQASSATIGYNFRRYIGSALSNTANNRQPTHLRKFEVESELVRHGKTSTYMYSAKNTNHSPDQDDTAKPTTTAGTENRGSTLDSSVSPSVAASFGFATVRPHGLASGDGSTLSALSRSAKEVVNKTPRQRRLYIPESVPTEPCEPEVEDPSAALPNGGGSPLGGRIETEVTPGPLENQADAIRPGSQGDERVKEPEKLPGKTPGAYIGEPGSLNPPRRKQGRPKKSLVVIFKSEKLKSSHFFENPPKTSSLFTSVNQSDPHPGPTTEPDLEVQARATTAEATSQNGVQIEVPDTSYVSVDSSIPRGGRGRPVKKNKATAGTGGKPFKCEKCGGAWKNILGLKYHQTKAQTPCNPNFSLLPPPEERKRQRRRPVEAEDEQHDSKRRKTGARGLGATPKRRGVLTAPRLVRGPTPTFRGLEIDEEPPSRADQESAAPVEEPTSSPSPVKNRATRPSRRGKGVISPQVSSAAPSKPGVPEQAPDSMEIDSAAVGTADGVETPKDNTVSKESATSPKLDSVDSTAAVSTKPERPSDEEATPAPPPPPIPVLTTSNQTSTSEDHQQIPPHAIEDEIPIQPFRSTTDYRRLFSESKIKTRQAVEIMEYLLENNGGAFPGDKALFYAVIRVFLNEFSGQNPPTFNNCKVALRDLTNRKRAREIVHAFRHTDGKMVITTMLVRSGLDHSSTVALALKKKIQDAYPDIFIPAAFSPSREELLLLRELEQERADTERKPKDGSIMRTRRDLMGGMSADLEVLDAPFYSQNMSLDGVETPEDGFDDHGQRQQNRQSLKRPRAYNAREPTEMDSIKRAKTGPSPARGRHTGTVKDSPKTAATYLSPTPREPVEQWEDRFTTPPTDSRQVSSEPQDQELAELSGSVYMSHFDPLNTKPTSVADAIKLFDLLPAKRRKRRDLGMALASPSKKSSRQRNPGLDTLPAGFFTGHGSGITAAQRHHRAAQIQFLEPNMDLGGSAEFISEDEEPCQSLETSSAATPDTDMADLYDIVKKDGLAFMPGVTLKDKAPGLWPGLNSRYFAEQASDASFSVQGWFPDPLALLSQNMPVDVDDILSRVKGRVGRRTAWRDTLFGKFCTSADRIMSWELSSEGTAVLSVVAAVPDYAFINLSADVSRANMAPVTPIWWDSNMFDLDSLPYDDLAQEELENDETLVKKPRGRPRRDALAAQNRFSVRKGSSPRRGRKPKNRLRLVPLNTSRQHTAYPKSADDFFVARDSEEGNEEWYSERTRLAAFICVTTLVGGVSQSVDWGLMLRLFPDLSLSGLRRFWGDARKDRMTSIINYTKRFRQEFLRAYENSEVPPINYDDIPGYDWKFLTFWTRKLLGNDVATVSLPASMKELEDQNLTVAEPAFKGRDWRETYFNPVRSYFDRFQDATSQAISIPIYRARRTATPSVAATMSWIRALYVTPPARYPFQVVQQRLKQLCGLPAAERTKLIEEASVKLRDQTMIAKSSGRGLADMRPWKLHGRVLKLLDKTCQEQKYAEAVEFKKQLDACFRQGEKAVVKYVCNDGMVMAILNLFAHHRVNIETTGQPHVPMGYEPFNYETRKYPKKYHHFKMHLTPTASYLDDDDVELVELRSRIEAAKPPVVGPNKEIPLWCDIFGQVDNDRWLKCLGAVFFMFASRGATGADALANTLKPALMAFEVQLIIDWGVKLGLLRSREGTAPAPTEWWWLVVEAQRTPPRAGGRDERGLKPGLVGSGASAPNPAPAPPVGMPAVGNIPPTLGPVVSSGSGDGPMDVDK